MNPYIAGPKKKRKLTWFIEMRVNRKVRALIGKPDGRLGYGALFDMHKKRILMEEYGIEWLTLQERHPGVSFD